MFYSLFVVCEPDNFLFYYQLVIYESDDTAARPGERITPVYILNYMIMRQGDGQPPLSYNNHTEDVVRHIEGRLVESFIDS